MPWTQKTWRIDRSENWEPSGFLQFIVLPDPIPEDRRVDAAVAVAMANYGIINGCFDFDISDGELNFRLAQSYMGIEFSDELIFYMLNVTFFSTDKYNDRFFKLCNDMMTLEEFIQAEAR